MKFTLKDYQDDAVRDILKQLRKGGRRWHGEGERSAFSLTAPTGAGKTVMVAAVLEALFHGEDLYDVDADKGAVVLWFSDSPDLNEQTRFRLMESSDRLRHTDMVVVEHPFSRQRFEAGKIYFLNTQKLGKKSLLVRGFDEETGGDAEPLPGMRPDMQAHTLWDTVRNSIEDPSLTVYLVLDEAHRGMGRVTTQAVNERTTLVKRLINGERGVPGIPVVLGISATAERFNQAMAGARGRVTLESVEVDPERVRESGLLKDTLLLDIPDEGGQFETQLLKRGTEQLRQATEEWARYAASQGDGEEVVPLMVVQVPNTPGEAEVAAWLRTVFEAWPQLRADSVANVLGEHREEHYGPYKVPYIEPQRVQESTWVRVLLAKDAISTGWDCPRAEVMVSFRRAQDETHIRQLLGRMVRSPLARRIPGNDRLNSVNCLLPHFDKKAVEAVVKALQSGEAGLLSFGRALIHTVEVKPAAGVPQALWKKFTTLPTQTLPQRGAKPPIRLTALAHELASDGLLERAGAKAHRAMHEALDAFVGSREIEFRAQLKNVRTFEGRTIVAGVHGGPTRDRSFTEQADRAAREDAFRAAARIFSPDIARTYTEARAKRRPEAVDDFEGALIEARDEVAAIGLLDGLEAAFHKAAKELSDRWFAEYRERIKELPDDRQESYRQIVALSRQPQDVDLARPLSRIEPVLYREDNGAESPVPLWDGHLLVDEKGKYPAELNGWERKVLAAETSREGFKYWYRNPDRPAQDSLGVAYQIDDQIRLMRPDFLFFAEAGKGKYAVDIVDPHRLDYTDALPKLWGLAQYAEDHPGAYRRIEAVAEVGGDLKMLDLTDAKVRKAVRQATSAAMVYEVTGKGYG